VNPLASPGFTSLSAAIAFIGCNGVDLAAGVTNVNLPEAEIKQVMVRAAERRVVVADSTKLARVALARICDIDDVDVVVTDDGADPTFVDDLRDRGVDVVVASTTST
jgi:DeoR family transcriptional regulator of aga operon